MSEMTRVGDLDLWLDGPEPGPDGLTLVLTHGAGAPVDSPFLEDFARGVGASGIRVVRFELPYMRARRHEGKRRPPDREPVLRAAWHEAIAAIAAIGALGGPDRLVIGGKSMGGRMASLVADESGVRGLVCLGYPFHPPGKPETLRVAHLENLRTPTLIVQGTRDALGTREEVEGYRLSPQIRIAWMEDGDHSLAPRVSSGRTKAQNLEAAVGEAAAFVESLR
jgi:predicted alpha/beta-hydrolase family hydrolase